ncbi:heterokaryon incompatibility protein-domain-containing protein [Trametes maxima]|nr:heterokaryon incompatibility protein-domain-containing protein [Trametes maxima]
MRFLETYSGQFVWVDDPRKERYAILSHTWRPEEDGGEQSYEDVRRIQNSYFSATQGQRGFRILRLFRRNRTHIAPPISVLSRPDLSKKIKRICEVARNAGYRLVWIDSCCIDKSSSAELSEALNSMFEWYRHADVCYAYLADVPEGDDPTDERSAFWKSRWHRRGWTLQELVAPKRVVFLTQSWSFLQTKMGLASTLEKITRIDRAVLAGRASLDSVSVSRRLSWAAHRYTTRVEDKAYSLMGIFGVHLSPIYGEGRNAFYRLQQEIIMTIPDQSIFVWGRSCALIGLDEVDHDFESPLWEPEDAGLLAPSPWYFSRALHARPLSPADFAFRVGWNYQELPPLHCVFTSQGVRVQLLCFDLTPLPQISHAVFNAYHGYPDICASCQRRGLAHYLALLRCESDADDSSVVALPLCSVKSASGIDGASHREGLITATHISCGQQFHDQPFRVVCMTQKCLQDLRERIPPVVREVFIRMSSSPSTQGYAPEITREVVEDPVTIHIAPTCIEELGVLGCTISPLRVTFDRPVISVQNLLATTILSFKSERTVRLRVYQDIHIGLVLSCGASEQHADLVSAWRLEMAHFTVRHLFRMPTKHDSLLSSGGPCPPYVSHESPLADSGHITRRADWVSGPGLVKQAQAEFILRADPDLDLERAFDVRLLRITLEPEQTPETSEGRTCHSLRLFIEVSEPYQPDRKFDLASIWSRPRSAPQSDINGREGIMTLSDFFDDDQATSRETSADTSVQWAPTTLNALGINDPAVGTVSRTVDRIVPDDRLGFSPELSRKIIALHEADGSCVEGSNWNLTAPFDTLHKYMPSASTAGQRTALSMPSDLRCLDISNTSVMSLQGTAGISIYERSE